jgi:hypothetical protein
MEAARAAPPATRPAQLYYALSQAGRAMTAAHAPDPSPHGHGLKLGPIEKRDLMRTVVRPDGKGEYQIIAGVTGSPELTGEVELGALWVSLPDLVPFLLPDAGRWPLALRLHTRDFRSGASNDAEASIVFDPPVSPDEVSETLASYPAASAAGDWQLAGPRGVGVIYTGTSAALHFRWPLSASHEDERAEEASDLFDQIAPQHRLYVNRWLRPGLGPNLDQVSPLMTWWVLLFALSILARYEPGDWVRALDLDRSEVAAALHAALDEALTAVPHLVLEALRREPFLMTRLESLEGGY